MRKKEKEKEEKKRAKRRKREREKRKGKRIRRGKEKREKEKKEKERMSTRLGNSDVSQSSIAPFCTPRHPSLLKTQQATKTPIFTAHPSDHSTYRHSRRRMSRTCAARRSSLPSPKSKASESKRHSQVIKYDTHTKRDNRSMTSLVSDHQRS